MLYPTNLKSTIRQYREKGMGPEHGGRGRQPKTAQKLLERPKRWVETDGQEMGWLNW